MQILSKLDFYSSIKLWLSSYSYKWIVQQKKVHTLCARLSNEICICRGHVRYPRV